MGAIHAACLRSFVRNGHDVVLHSYSVSAGVPKGVRIFDASKLMCESEIIPHKDTGSLAIASDIYRIQREGLDLYVDCDVYCLKLFLYQEYTFARESDLQINPVILKLPQDCKLLKKYFEVL